MIGRSYCFVSGRMKKIGLIVPADIIEQRKHDSRLKKGNIPPNKGKKMPAEVYAKAAPTMFRKGNLPVNTKYDGYLSLRIDKTGRPYYHIRISKGKFELLHRVVWQQANGEIPIDMIVSFKNGNTLDVSIENLELITRKENMLRNSVQRLPEDIRLTIQLIGALNRQINKRKPNPA